MVSRHPVFRFEQFHLDVARNATDDFNPFHDPVRWSRVSNNPYGAAIALGFQLEVLVDYLIDRRRDADARSQAGSSDQEPSYSNYELRFAGAIRPGEDFQVEIRSTLDASARGGGLSNRFLVRRTDGSPILVGSRADTRECRFPSDGGLPDVPRLSRLPDRSWVPGSGYFLKRKFLTTSNAKNFVLASLGDQRYYFDELDEKVRFPPLFPVSLVSCALLEKKWREPYDFEQNPVVYTQHQISVDRRLQRELRSNDRLDILVAGPERESERRGLGNTALVQDRYRCFGYLSGNLLLFCAQVRTADLSQVL